MEVKKQQMIFLAHGALAAFGAYFCMYAFRKPFSAVPFEGLGLWGMDYKILLIIAQVLGYAISKFAGIRYVSEMEARHRPWYLVGMILLAELSLVLFALIPAPYNFLLMIFNGLTLGMVWGIVFSYLEGRKFTEILGVALCGSFIVSSGVVKSIGLWTMDQWSISAFWMPAVTGAIFILPMVVFAWMLERLPAPSPEDEALKSPRVPMTKEDRMRVMTRFIFPLLLLVFFYTLLTAFRDFRDNFARELWDSVGFEGDIMVFSYSEMIVAVVVLLILGGVVVIRDNLKALNTYFALLLMGVLTVGGSTMLFQAGILSPFSWMVASGFGLYICYVPFNCLFFDRFIGVFHLKANAGFLIYIADAFGYLGSVMVLVYKNFFMDDISWLNFFIYSSYMIALVGFILMIISRWAIQKKYKAITSEKLMIHEQQV
ncbi:hypothetical protein GCM10007049_02310 [Echinicola pacifica]|uniref:Uncharacterized protein n=1 Tax=Echinicola pacifica TaxID=346377 RepID=A0A918PK86_9BACT|nr:DUF5690 family protein [Echinicola pacifica]GGZ14002.1 hypothetical protein GCM10007049_02310 [Echinicola pacifica]